MNLERKPLVFSGLLKIWLGRQDSNLRMTESESVALPLGYTPFDEIRSYFYWKAINA